MEGDAVAAGMRHSFRRIFRFRIPTVERSTTGRLTTSTLTRSERRRRPQGRNARCVYRRTIAPRRRPAGTSSVGTASRRGARRSLSALSAAPRRARRISSASAIASCKRPSELTDLPLRCYFFRDSIPLPPHLFFLCVQCLACGVGVCASSLARVAVALETCTNPRS